MGSDADETLLSDGGLDVDDSCTNEYVSVAERVDEQQNVEVYIEKLIRDDNMAELISFWRSHGHSCHFSPTHLFNLICLHRAVKCATAMLEENSGFCVDVNARLESGLLPLQLAAQSLSFGLASILLDHGAQANLCGEHGSIDIEMLPLNMALKAVRDQHVRDWSPEKSIYKLLYIFCLRDLKEPLETIKLLAERTEDIEKVSLYCVEVGEVVQLAALLMVAWNRLIPPDVEDAEKSLMGQHIWRQIGLVSNQELLMMISCGPNCDVLEGLKSKKINFVTEWRFLKLLEIARDVIEDHYDSWIFENSPKYELPFEIAYNLSRDTELVLKPDDVLCDDIDCLRPKLSAKQKALLNEAIEEKMQAIEAKMQKTSNLDQSEVVRQKFATLTASSSVESSSKSGCCSLFSSMCSPSSRAYHTWGDLSINLKKLNKIQVPNKIHKVARPSLSVFSPSAKICGRLLLSAKKIMI